MGKSGRPALVGAEDCAINWSYGTRDGLLRRRIRQEFRDSSGVAVSGRSGERYGWRREDGAGRDDGEEISLQDFPLIAAGVQYREYLWTHIRRTTVGPRQQLPKVIWGKFDIWWAEWDHMAQDFSIRCTQPTVCGSVVSGCLPHFSLSPRDTCVTSIYPRSRSRIRRTDPLPSIENVHRPAGLLASPTASIGCRWT